MITLHHLNHSRSQRILWLLEELELPYELVTYQRDSKTQLAPPSLKKAHPLGKSPVIEDDETGLVVCESGAIIEYLLEQYDTKRKFLPESLMDKTRARIWIHFAEGSLMPFLLIELILRRIDESKMPFFAKPVARKITGGVRDSFLNRNIEQTIQYLYEQLKDSAYFVGEQVSAADFAMIFPLEALVSTGYLEPYPTELQDRFIRYVRAIQSRPAYQRGLERGGDYKYLVGE